MRVQKEELPRPYYEYSLHKKDTNDVESVYSKHRLNVKHLINWWNHNCYPLGAVFHYRRSKDFLADKRLGWSSANI